MRLTNSTDRYGAVLQFLRWVMVALVITAWLLGQFVDDLPCGALSIHISAGLALLLLLVLRLVWRMADPPPRAEPTVLGPWLDYAGRLAHYALYLLLAVVPVVGIVAQFARGGYALGLRAL